MTGPSSGGKFSKFEKQVEEYVMGKGDYTVKSKQVTERRYHRIPLICGRYVSIRRPGRGPSRTSSGMAWAVTSTLSRVHN